MVVDEGRGASLKSAAGLLTPRTWGNPQQGEATPGHAFTGREWDPETGLYYYRARDYDPKLARFVSEDPIGFRGGLNSYAYVRNNPVALSDPEGLAPFRNNSNRSIPYKPEECPPGTPCQIKLCKPGETCDVDGVYPPDCSSNPVKVINRCRAEATPDGKLKVICPVPFNAAQWALGGPVSNDFMTQHPDWPPPNQAPGCQSTCK